MCSRISRQQQSSTLHFAGKTKATSREVENFKGKKKYVCKERKIKKKKQSKKMQKKKKKKKATEKTSK